MKILKNILNIVVCLTLVVITTSIKGQTSENEKIKAVWISSDSPGWKFDIKSDGKCYESIDNNLFKTYYFSIETTSPQCGIIVPTGPLHSYLKLVNITDPDDVYCYEIFSLDSEYLQIRMLERSSFLLFRKQ